MFGHRELTACPTLADAACRDVWLVRVLVAEKDEGGLVYDAICKTVFEQYTSEAPSFKQARLSSSPQY